MVSLQVSRLSREFDQEQVGHIVRSVNTWASDRNAGTTSRPDGAWAAGKTGRS